MEAKGSGRKGRSQGNEKVSDGWKKGNVGDDDDKGPRKGRSKGRKGRIRETSGVEGEGSK